MYSRRWNFCWIGGLQIFSPNLQFIFSSSEQGLSQGKSFPF